ncbi:Trna phosphotransferase 1 [Mycena kentingensis (nom. inval.)]|nr:Trna phosphotransferase 1 [Mycena kentingensis (nom. inval.)]
MDSTIEDLAELHFTEQKQPRNRNKSAKPKQQQQQRAGSGSNSKPSGGGGGNNRLRGLPKDSPEIRMSKTLSWLLRHGAQSERLPMRADGFVKVSDLLANKRVSSESLDFGGLQDMVAKDSKQRFNLKQEGDIWWIAANQGHSMKSVKLETKPILSLEDIPTKIAVHGTTNAAWNLISKTGLSKMTRNHIHLAQGVAGDSVVSGMRKSSQVLIFVDVERALADGVKFSLSDNGVVLTEGDDRGFLATKYFSRVETAKRVPVPGWEGDPNPESPAA